MKYPWKRFWCPPDALLRLEPDGFLTDCEDKYGKLLATDIKEFQEIESVHCLILLGEPGIGKSTAIQDEILRQQAKASGEVIVIDLKQYGSEELLWKDLFERKAWENWIKGDYSLHLFLDSLDEARIRIHNIQGLLLRGFRDCRRDNLFVRIACRTAEWPSSFYDQFCDLWLPKNVKMFELSPLSRRNVIQAAQLNEINVDEFMKAIHEKGLGALASKPITFGFLLNLFADQGDFPAGQIELYRRGCLYLCEEPDKERREKRDINKLYSGMLSAEERFIVAARIAAVLTFSNAYAVDRDSSRQAPEGSVHVAQLAGGIEAIDGTAVTISEDAIHDTLKTGLFSSRGPDLFGFAHQTYQEYLAAQYLRKADIAQIKELLTHPYNGDIIVPQLRETAAWIAGNRPDVMQWIVSIEPDTVLRSDLSRTDASTKRALIRELLKRLADDELFDDMSIRDNYHRLTYADMADDLKATIEDRAASFIPRRAAIDIAEACRAVDLQVLLADIALDARETEGMRAQAAHAVYEIADDDTRRRLEPLAEGKLGPDPDDELKASGLKCMWPSHWAVSRLFENLTPVKNKHLVAAYTYFLHYELPEQLRKGVPVQEIPKILAFSKGWLGKNTEYDPHDFGRIYNELLRLSFKHIPDQRVMAELSDHICRSLVSGRFFEDYKEDQNPWEEIKPQAEKRHHMVKYMIANGKLTERDATLLFTNEMPLLLDSDFPWMLGQVENTAAAEQPIWAKIIVAALHPDLPVSWINDFLEVRLRIPVLQGEYPVFWELDSDLSKTSKERYYTRLRWQEKARRRPRVAPIVQRAEPLLRSIEDGDIEKWFSLTHNLWVDEDTGQLKHEGQIDLRESPGWKALDQTYQNRIDQVAVVFIRSYSSFSDDWLGKGSWDSRILSISAALLVLARRTDVADGIKSDEWRKRIPYMVGEPVFFNDTSAHCCLFSLAFQKDPEATKGYLVRLMKSEDRAGNGIYCLEHLKECWHPDLTKLTRDILAGCDIKPASWKSVVQHLINVGAEDVEAIVIDKFRRERENHSSDDMVLALALLLFRNWAEKHWADLWEFLNEDKNLASRVLGHIDPAYRRSSKFPEQLSDSHLGDLYSFMHGLGPPNEDPPLEDGGTWTGRHRFAELRNSVFMILVNRGTREACTSIESLIEKFPDQRSWMTWRLREARMNYFRKTWNPPSVLDIVQLASDSSKRYVESEEELLKVLSESIRRFQDHCKNISFPAVANFWNYEGSGNNRTNFRPKDEEDLSDGIAAWLRDDLGPSRGIVVNREVQPRRGQETDVYVNAVSRSGSGDSVILAVVIEVKGCWNKELYEAMETQLANRYMNENGIACGLYIAGWYFCNKWDDSDYRKNLVKVRDAREMSDYFLKQAQDITAKNDFVSRLESFVLDLTL